MLRRPRLTFDLQPDHDYVERVVMDALDVGYRHFDTARVYSSEVGVGRALQKAFQSGKVTRDDVFITTKVCVFQC